MPIQETGKNRIPVKMALVPRVTPAAVATRVIVAAPQAVTAEAAAAAISAKIPTREDVKTLVVSVAVADKAKGRFINLSLPSRRDHLAKPNRSCGVMLT